uniref:(northern house mosquito) hypothetical protein n=1 Tax=Culex pipiens TaxID=7175 RepID=A0A8D8E7Y6_CULPI
MSHVITDVVVIISSTGYGFGTSTGDVNYHTNTNVAEHQSISGTTVCDSAMDFVDSWVLDTATGIAGQGDHWNGQSERHSTEQRGSGFKQEDKQMISSDEQAGAQSKSLRFNHLA